MWSFTTIAHQNGFPNHRQFSTGPDLNKMASKQFIPQLHLDNGFENCILREKGFTNPNFVNKENPKLHNYQNTTLSSTICHKGKNNCSILEICSKFAEKKLSSEINEKKDTEIIEEIPTKEIMCKKNKYHKRKRNKKNNKETTKKTTKHSLSSYRKEKNINPQTLIKMEMRNIDEIGIDISSELTYNSEDDIFYDHTQPKLELFHKDTTNEPNFSDEVSSSPICITIGSIGTEKCQAHVVFSISPPKSFLRRKLSSECDSEDSFIIFDNHESDYDQTDSEYESDETDDDDDDCKEEKDLDEIDFASSIKNESESDDRLKSTIGNCKKVRFADEKNLCKIYPMVKWSYAYRCSRKGPWEEYARDTDRFKRRIKDSEKILGEILKLDHRGKIYNQRFNE